MYLLTTHIPIFVDDATADRPRTFVTASWHHDLGLARDWLAAPYGTLEVLAPRLPLPSEPKEELTQITEDDGFRAVPSFDGRVGMRQFWGAPRRRFVADLERELADTTVLHTSAAFTSQPVWYLSMRVARRFDVTKLLVGPDMDPSEKDASGTKARLQRALFERMLRRAAPIADIMLAKEGLVLERYGHLARRVEAFCHSVHGDDQVVSAEGLEARLASLPGRSLRAVYAGRLVARKGVADAIDAIAEAKAMGTPIEYHLFGSGPDEAALRERAEARGVADLVVFRGWVDYDAKFLGTLAAFDLLLFMPTEEDTPRMAYDAMAAGLPLVGTRIPFLEHRNRQDQASTLVDIGDSNAAARELQRLSEDPEALGTLARAARKGGEFHTVETWFRRRAAWTREAHEARLAGSRAES